MTPLPRPRVSRGETGRGWAMSRRRRKSATPADPASRAFERRPGRLVRVLLQLLAALGAGFVVIAACTALRRRWVLPRLVRVPGRIVRDQLETVSGRRGKGLVRQYAPVIEYRHPEHGLRYFTADWTQDRPSQQGLGVTVLCDPADREEPLLDSARGLWGGPLKFLVGGLLLLLAALLLARSSGGLA